MFITHYLIFHCYFIFRSNFFFPESVCYWPPETGPCFANFQHFYYNKETGTCQIFTYGGCLGNANNFETKKACKKKCQTGICSKVGPCHRALQRYYYNRFKGTCEPFIYGGCQGNENNFLTVEACENTCNRGICSVCHFILLNIN
ncbi:unnamed protein product [Staurois parvus]|uniref:BPTI/Kunitz inhibitor domain-containing protein n=1 Tax=Staurois parvus TaxID=386267 RepID=A0ABN9ANV6_9NEOB|nr:unnamed protein product [Staurois parvus]